MSGPAIRVENLGKMYRIGGPVERYRTFRDTVAQGFARAGRRVRSWFGGGDGAAPKYETIWALKDVSFEIEPGEVVGVIGRNGAGKSTLLKILSRITEPTEGRAEVRGRVGSLLEVGTGFHPELTGRENVYLNGAILGMKRAEVDRKFDEIVAFAEIEKFIDTPVKHYSSGMYLRLAFSVAAHLEPEILLVDEVLAVGDQAFQQKCLGIMRDVAREGRTVMLVSHQLPAVQHLCERAIQLSGGMIVRDGAAFEVIEEYRREVGTELARNGETVVVGRVGCFEFAEPYLRDSAGQRTSTAVCGEDLVFCLPYSYGSWPEKHEVEISIGFKNAQGVEVTSCPSMLLGRSLRNFPQTGEIRCYVRRTPFVPGIYTVDLWISIDRYVQKRYDGVLLFHVLEGDYYKTGRPPRAKQTGVLIDFSWATEVIDSNDLLAAM